MSFFYSMVTYLLTTFLVVFNCVESYQMGTVRCGQAPLNPMSNSYLKNDWTAEEEIGTIDSDDNWFGQSRIFYGVAGTYGHWPWIVTFRRRKSVFMDKFRDTSCSGALISRNQILTVAHCIGMIPYKLADFRVVVGNHRLNSTDTHEKDYKVASICLAANYCNYAGKLGGNDWLLLTLKKNVTFNEYVQPICLPWKVGDETADGSAHQLESYDELINSGNCYTVGFGRTEETQVSNVLMVLPLEPLFCSLDIIGVLDTQLRKSLHCFAKPKNRSRGDTCNGDSGGPLSCYSSRLDAWVLMGLTSSGSSDCSGRENEGSFYVNTTNILKDLSDRNCYDPRRRGRALTNKFERLSTQGSINVCERAEK